MDCGTSHSKKSDSFSTSSKGSISPGVRLLYKILDSSDCAEALRATAAIGIGAQRSGTTWLSRYLDRHPEVLTSTIKELHVFDSLVLRRDGGIESRYANALINRDPISFGNTSQKESSYPDIADRVALTRISGGYYKYFEKRLTSSHTAFSETTPEYALLSPKAYKIIHESHPDLRFFFLLRDPVQRYLSALRYWGRLRPKFSYKENIEKGITRKLFTRYSRYNDTLNNIYKYVPRNRVHVFFSEELFSDTDAVLKEFCGFMSISYLRPTDLGLSTDELINSTKSEALTTSAKLNSIKNAFIDVYEELPALIHRDLPSSWAS